MHGTRLADGVSRAVPEPIAPMPIRPLSALTALLHVYIALRLVPALAVLTPAWPLALVALAVSARFGLFGLGIYLLSGGICTLAALAINRAIEARD